MQGTLWDATGPAGPWLEDYGQAVRRGQLSRGAWVDVRPLWLHGGDDLMEQLVAQVPWRSETRPMYDRMVATPRLVSFYGDGDPLPHPVLDEMRERLSAHYAPELGEPFVTAGLCYYRDGRDSVAWHGDRIGRGRDADTMVVILSLGATRRLLLRPRGGGPSLAFPMGQGDVVVMGGSCQRTWDHAIPKTAVPVGGRISVQFRVAGVR